MLISASSHLQLHSSHKYGHEVSGGWLARAVEWNQRILIPTSSKPSPEIGSALRYLDLEWGLRYVRLILDKPFHILNELAKLGTVTSLREHLAIRG
jgi:hypothetical protein